MERMEPLLAYVWGRCVVPGEKLQVGSFWRSGRNINTSNIGTNLLSLLQQWELYRCSQAVPILLCGGG